MKTRTMIIIYWVIVLPFCLAVYLMRDETAKRDAVGALLFFVAVFLGGAVIGWYRKKKGIH